MAYDKVVDSAKLDADLTMVADAIRDTGVTDEQISFPDGYKDEIDTLTDFLLKLYERKPGVYIHVPFPKGLTIIGRHLFMNCQRFLFPIEFPEGVTKIEYYAFQNCFEIENVVMPSSMDAVGDYAFANCVNLTSVTFKSKPSTLYATAFKHCSKLTTINVPWAEGEVADAPWGATNATINYNYTGEG